MLYPALTFYMVCDCLKWKCVTWYKKQHYFQKVLFTAPKPLIVPQLKVHLTACMYKSVLSFSLSVCPSVFISSSPPPLRFHFPTCSFLGPSISNSLSLSFFLSLSLSLSLYIYIYISSFIHLSLLLIANLFLSLSLSIYISISSFIHFSLLLIANPFLYPFIFFNSLPIFTSISSSTLSCTFYSIF